MDSLENSFKINYLTVGVNRLASFAHAPTQLLQRALPGFIMPDAQTLQVHWSAPYARDCGSLLKSPSRMSGTKVT